MLNAIETLRAIIASGALKSDARRVAGYLSHDATCAIVARLIPGDAMRAMNQKALMRAAQACDFLRAGDVRQCDEVTSAMVAIIALTAQENIAFSAAHIACGATREGSAINGVSRARLARFLPRTSNLGTITSKVSRTVGVRGLFTALGITCKGDAHSFTLAPGAKSSPFIVAYAAGLEAMTDGAFALLQEGRSE